MKSRDGHGGTEVFLLQDPEDARRYQNEVRRRRSALLDNTCRIPSARHSGLPAEGHAANGAEPSLPADTDTAWIYQEMADTPGKDLRVYVTGNRITAAMLRSSETDFRSNYCLGGQASVYKLSGTEKRIVDTILSSLDIGHCGIDFLFHKGHLIFNELEDVVGSRMLYRYTDIDVVSDYIDFILRDLHHM